MCSPQQCVCVCVCVLMRLDPEQLRQQESVSLSLSLSPCICIIVDTRKRKYGEEDNSFGRVRTVQRGGHVGLGAFTRGRTRSGASVFSTIIPLCGYSLIFSRINTVLSSPVVPSMRLAFLLYRCAIFPSHSSIIIPETKFFLEEKAERKGLWGNSFDQNKAESLFG